MKKICLLVVGLSYLALVLIMMPSCGQQVTDPVVTTTTTRVTTTTVPVVGVVSISGSLYTGIIRTSAVRASATGVHSMGVASSPIPNYSVVAVGTTDNKLYFADAETSTNGSFKISNLPSGESYYLELIDDQKRFIAPVSFGVTTEGVVMAVTPESGGGPINLGQIVYESGKGAAVPTLEISAGIQDETSTAKKKSGEAFVSVGTGLNLGRGTEEAKFVGTLKDKVDEDNDGLPDAIDVDDNGDGKVDGLDPIPRLANRVQFNVTGLNNANTFSNLPEQYELYPSYINGSLNTTSIDVATKTILAIEVVMTQGTSPSIFSSAKVVDGPAWCETATISQADPNTYASYPVAGTLWKNVNYNLYAGNGRWTVWVIPNGTPEAGDVLRFMVTTTSGATEEFISTITYIFVDVPKLVGYSYLDGATTVTKEAADLNLSTYQGGAGGKSNTFGYKGDTLTMIWLPPRDDLGNPLTGLLHYLDGINYYNSSDQQIGSTSLAIDPTTIEAYQSFGLAYSYTFTPTNEPTLSHFKLDIKDQSPASGGGNASQMINFKKM